MAKIVINADIHQATVNRHIYGHFAEHLGRCIYEGIWVGEDSDIPHTDGIRNDVLAVLKKLKIPNLRWPGGCFADTYHWMDGIGPREQRKSIVNTHWGGVTENNHFGTHEFLRLCELLECAPYICGNVGSGTVREMAEWVEYMSSDAQSPMTDLRKANGRDKPWRLPYFGIGNENWGCGGSMRPEYYADLYKRYATYVRGCGCPNSNGGKIYRIACGPNGEDLHWMEVMMRDLHPALVDGVSLHYYTINHEGNWEHKSGATGFGADNWYGVLVNAVHMERVLARQCTVMDRYDPDKKIGLIVDEWGTWFDVEPGTNPGFLYQQNTMRDAVVAAMHFHMFHARADRIHMTNIAQTVNVLQAMCLTDKEKMILTPTYHVFEMYKVHQDATTVPLHLDTPAAAAVAGRSIPAVHGTATVNDAGTVHVGISNQDADRDHDVTIDLRGGTYKCAQWRLLQGGALDAHNTFEQPETVAPRDADVPQIKDGKCAIKLPPASVSALAFKPV